MKKFLEFRSTCSYRDGQKCNYWEQTIQCHYLACPLISELLEVSYIQEEKKQITPPVVDTSVFDRAYQVPKPRALTPKKPVDELIPPQPLPIVQPVRKKKKRQEPKEKEREKPKNETLEPRPIPLKEEIEESLEEVLVQKVSRPQMKITCERCGYLITEQTVITILNPNGTVYYIHAHGRCSPHFGKIREARERWLRRYG
ncbi:MAG: hypothetical protein ACFE8U_14080 [Candidatus Hermodarchaeota archaeon]